MHKLLRWYLWFLAHMILVVKKPKIIGVTGTIGKTTITSFLGQFLGKEFGEGQVGFSRFYYNGEFGLPLTIINAESPGKNILGWFRVGCIALLRLVQKYPKYIVCEYGIDKPGEMGFLLSIARPEIAILTPISPNHIEQFGDFTKYQQEKISLLFVSKYRIVHESFWDVLGEHIGERTYWYGENVENTIFFSNVVTQIEGTSAKIHTQDTVYNIKIPFIGKYHVENILPIFLIADILNISQQKIVEFVSNFENAAGRATLFTGIHNTHIIDGTYNGGFSSITEGITTMIPFISKYPIAFFLGDMRELGTMTESLHKKLATQILLQLPHDANVAFFLVGPCMEKYVFPEISSYFYTAVSLSSKALAGEILGWIESQSSSAVVYAKGSQNTIFLEEGLKVLLPAESHKKLCRQSNKWMKEKNLFFANIDSKIEVKYK